MFQYQISLILFCESVVKKKKKSVSFQIRFKRKPLPLQDFSLKVSTVSSSATLLFITQLLYNYLLSTQTSNWHIW